MNWIAFIKRTGRKAVADRHRSVDRRLRNAGLNGCLEKTLFSSVCRPAYPGGIARAAARVGASKHLDPLQQRIDAVLGRQGEIN